MSLSWDPTIKGGGGGGVTQHLVLSNTTLSLVPDGGSVVIPTTTVSSIGALNVSTLVAQEGIFLPSLIGPTVRILSTGQIIAASINAPLVTAFTGSFALLGTTTANIVGTATASNLNTNYISTGSISTNQFEANDAYISSIYTDYIDTKGIQFVSYTNRNLPYGTGFDANAGVLQACNTVMYGHNDNPAFNAQYEVNADLIQYGNSVAVLPNLSTGTLRVSSFVQMPNGSNLTTNGPTLTYGGSNITTGTQGNAANWAQYPANSGYINFNNGSLNNINGISAQAGNMDLLTNYQQSQTNVNIGRYDVTLFPPTYQPNVNVGANNINLQAGVALGEGSTAGYFTGNSINNDVYPGVASILNLNDVNSHYNIVAHGGFDIPAVPNPLWPAVPPQYLSPSINGGRGIINLTAYNSYLAGVVPNPFNPGEIKLNASIVNVGNNNTLPFGESALVNIQANVVDIIAGSLGAPNLFGVTGLTTRSRNGVAIRNMSLTSNTDSKLFVRELWGQSVAPIDGGITNDRNIFIQAQGNPGVTLSNVKTLYGQTEWGYNGVDIVNLNTATGNYPNAVTSNLSSLQGQINALTISTTGGTSSVSLWWKYPGLSTVVLNQGLAFNNFASPSLAPIQSYNGVIFTDFNNQLNTMGVGALALGLTGPSSLSTVITPLSQGGIGIYKINSNTVLGDVAAHSVIFDNIYPLNVSTGQLYFNGSPLLPSTVVTSQISTFSTLTSQALLVSSITGISDLSVVATTLYQNFTTANVSVGQQLMTASSISTTLNQLTTQTAGSESQIYMDKTQAYLRAPSTTFYATNSALMSVGQTQVSLTKDSLALSSRSTINLATTSSINLASSRIQLNGSLFINGLPYSAPSSIYVSTTNIVPANITVSSITMAAASASPQGVINFPKAVSGTASLLIQGTATNTNGVITIVNDTNLYDTLQASDVVLAGPNSSTAPAGFTSIRGGNNTLLIQTVDSAGMPTVLAQGANYKYALSNVSSINGFAYVPYTGGGGGGGGGSSTITNNYSTLIATDFWLSTVGANTMKMVMGLPPLGGSGLSPNTLTMTNQTISGTNANLAAAALYLTPYTDSPTLTNPLVISRNVTNGDVNMISYNYNQTSLPGALYTNFNNIKINAGAQSLNASTINFPSADLKISSINGLAPGSGSGSVSNWPQYSVIGGGSQWVDFGAQSIWLKGVGNAILTNQLGTSNLPLTAKYFTAFDPGGVPGIGLFGLDGDGIPSILGGYSLPTQLHVSTLQVSGSNIISANPSTILVNGQDPVANWYTYNTAYSTINIVQADNGVSPLATGSAFPSAGTPITIDNQTAYAITTLAIADNNGNTYPSPSPPPGPYGSYTFTMTYAVPSGKILIVTANFSNGGYNSWALLNNSGLVSLQQFGSANLILVGTTINASGTGLIVDMRNTTYPQAMTILNDTTQGADLIRASNSTKAVTSMRIWETNAGYLSIDNNGSTALTLNGITTNANLLNANTITATVTSNVSTVASNVVFMDGSGLSNNNVLTGNNTGLYYKGVQLATASNVQTWSLYKAISSPDLNNNSIIGNFSTVSASPTSNYAIDLSNFTNYTTPPNGATTFGLRITSSNIVGCNHQTPQLSLFTDLLGDSNFGNNGTGILSLNKNVNAPMPFKIIASDINLSTTTLTANSLISGNLGNITFTNNAITPPVLNTLNANVDSMNLSTLRLANYIDVNDHGTAINGSVLMSPMTLLGLSSMGIKASGSPNFFVPMAIDMLYSTYGSVGVSYINSPTYLEPFPAITYVAKSKYGVLTGTWSYNGTLGSPAAFAAMRIGVGQSSNTTPSTYSMEIWSDRMNGINFGNNVISLVIDFSQYTTQLLTIKMYSDYSGTYSLSNVTIRWLGPGSFF